MVSAATDPRLEKDAGSKAGVRVVLVLEYDGTNYHGSQLQDGLPTIQGEVERALWKLTAEKVRMAAAGRTDAGVHALGQVISFGTDAVLSPAAYVGGLNYYLPHDIAVKSARLVGDAFDVRRAATGREYRYTLLNSRTRSPTREAFVYRVAGAVDVEAMSAACQELLGEHDFASFASGVAGESKSTVRTVYRAEVHRDGDLVFLDMEANAFLRHQVRSTAGCLVRVGQGKMSRDELRGVIEARQPGLAGPTLPARGLCLVRVNYPRSFEEEQT